MSEAEFSQILSSCELGDVEHAREQVRSVLLSVDAETLSSHVKSKAKYIDPLQARILAEALAGMGNELSRGDASSLLTNPRLAGAIAVGALVATTGSVTDFRELSKQVIAVSDPLHFGVTMTRYLRAEWRFELDQEEGSQLHVELIDILGERLIQGEALPMLMREGIPLIRDVLQAIAVWGSAGLIHARLDEWLGEHQDEAWKVVEAVFARQGHFDTGGGAERYDRLVRIVSVERLYEALSVRQTQDVPQTAGETEEEIGVATAIEEFKGLHVARGAS